MIKYIFGLAISMLFFSCNVKSQPVSKEVKSLDISVVVPEGKIVKIDKSESEWKKELSDSEYNVLRNQGTERPFTGDLLANKKEGVYVCRACQLPLFGSDTKFKSGTGWPSFYEPYTEKVIEENIDIEYGMRRVEVHCARCDGHMGHVFTDGPKPTGLRYCINSVSLDFVEKKKQP